MIPAAHVSAVLVTRGNVDLRPILATLPFDDVVVWDNSQRTDYSVYGRYAAIHEASNGTIYVQDDDAIVPVNDLLAVYEPGERLASHDRPTYTDSALIGWGAIFPRDAPFAAFDRWLLAGGARDRTFERCCDVIFTTLSPFRVHDVGHADLPWASGPGRMYTGEPDHYATRAEILDRCRAIRDGRRPEVCRVAVEIDPARPDDLAVVVEAYSRLFSASDLVELALLAPGPVREHADWVAGMLGRLGVDTSRVAEIRMYGLDEAEAAAFDVALAPARAAEQLAAVRTTIA